MSIITVKYNVINPKLIPFIKHYWVVRSDIPIFINHKLFPVRSPDVIINIGEPVIYEISGKVQAANNAYISAPKKTYCNITQTGILNIWGITFYPLGLYSFLKVPISDFSDSIVNLDRLMPDIANKMCELIATGIDTYKTIEELEKVLLRAFDFNLTVDKQFIKIINEFDKEDISSLTDIYKRFGVNERWIQRSFNKYIGITPNIFFRLNKLINLLAVFECDPSINLTELSYRFNYFDQSHLIREFKYFCGNTPKKNRNDESWVKHLLDNSSNTDDCIVLFNK